MAFTRKVRAGVVVLGGAAVLVATARGEYRSTEWW
jgi:hypothetical protein